MRHLNDTELVAELKELMRRERELVTDTLRYLREVEGRQIHLKRGYPSLFEFCRGELRLSETQTQTRLQAMRLLKDVPEIAPKLDTGEISLSVAAKAQGCIQREKIVEKKEFAALFVGASVREAEKKIATLFPERPRPERAKPVSGQLTRLEFHATVEMMKDLEALRTLTHNCDNLQEIFAYALRTTLAQAKKKVDAPVLVTSLVTRPKRTRNIPSATRREIWHRDAGKCQYLDPLTGKRCGSGHKLQVDHIHPYSLGGSHDPSNLQLLCGAHNRWKDPLAPGQKL